MTCYVRHVLRIYTMFWYHFLMLDVITRACLHPFDYLGVRIITDITFREKIQESENIYSFIFTAPKLPSWQSSNHALFSFWGEKMQGGNWRAFSVASAPHEGVIRIGTTFPEKPSDFKLRLLALKPGEKVRMFGPHGEMYVRKNTKQIIGLAGGIGITPFRSIIADLSAKYAQAGLTHKQSPVKLTLIYSARDSLYTFKSELESWRVRNPNIEIIYTATPEEVNAELEKQIATHQNNAHYFISGPPKMVESLRDSLRSKGLRNIVSDPFKGY